MAGEYLVINPRRRRHRKARSHSRRRRRHRRVHNGLAMNPRRRRRSHRRRRHSGRRRHYARNPRLFGAVNIGQIVSVGAGFIGTEFATPFITKLIPAPADANTGKLLSLGIKAGVGVFAIPMLLKMTPFRRFAGPFAIGAGVAVLADLWASYVAPALKLGDYQLAQLADYDQTAPGGALMGETAFGESIYSPAAY